MPLAHAAESPLADAAEKRNWPRVENLIKEKIDVNAAQTDGMTTPRPGEEKKGMSRSEPQAAWRYLMTRR